MEFRVGLPVYGGAFESNAGALPYVLPGEMVQLTSSGVAEVLESSPNRVTPGCIHFGVCGGCQYQHAGYPAQLEMKAMVLRKVLMEAGLDELPAAQIHAGEPWGYRNRVRFRVERVDGAMRLGYSRRGSNEFLAVRMCPIAAPVLWRAAQALLQLAERNTQAGQWLAATSEVELFTTGDEARVQMSLWLRDSGSGNRGQAEFTRLCDLLKLQLPELAGAGAALDPELGRRVRKGWSGVSWGAAGLAYAAAGRSYWVGRGAFFQINRFLVDGLVALVAAGRGGHLAWDLFAGVGLFSRALAGGFSRVVAVEGAESAAGSLAQVRAGTDARLEAVRAPALQFLSRRAIERERPELVVLDPPRAGLGAEGAELLARLGPAEIVYVSCDPVTLARDLRVLRAGGYSATEVHLVDLFPQTYHLETVVMLRRPMV